MLLKISLMLLLIGGCGTEQVKKIEGIHGKDGRDGRDGKDYTPTQPLPRPTYEPVPQPTFQPSQPQNTDVLIILTPPYPNCSAQGVCPPNSQMACVCLDGRWQTVLVMSSELHKYRVRNIGECYFQNQFELECFPKNRYPVPNPMPIPRC